MALHASRLDKSAAAIVILAVLSVSTTHAQPRKSTSAPAAADSAAPSEALALPFLTVMLARDPAVQDELGLNRTQLASLTQAIASVDLPLWQLRDVPVKDCGEKLDLLLAQFRQQLGEVLSAAELERFDQILFRARGSLALLTPEMVKRLEISPKQAAQIRAALYDTKHARDLAERELLDKTAAESAKQRTKRDLADSKKLLAPLTSKQQAQLSQLIGQPFDLSRIRRIGAIAPELQPDQQWINSQPLKWEALRGRVVVIHFWAFECINCVHNLPHYQAWFEKYSPQELTIIGIQTPETGAERDFESLRQNVEDRKIAYPVVLDRDASNWKLWANHTWPSVYVVDKRGQIRAWWYGELNWQGARGEESMRRTIEQLLAEKEG